MSLTYQNDNNHWTGKCPVCSLCETRIQPAAVFTKEIRTATALNLYMHEYMHVNKIINKFRENIRHAYNQGRRNQGGKGGSSPPVKKSKGAEPIGQ